MPAKVRTTVTISVAYNTTPLPGETPEACAARIEEEMHTNLHDKIRLLLALASGPGGTISWRVRPTREAVESKDEVGADHTSLLMEEKK